MLRIILVVLIVHLSGCIIIPTPEQEPYQEEQIARIHPGETTRDEIIEIFGPPDIVRENNTIWIFGAARHLAFLFSIFPAGGITEFIDDYQFIVVDFKEDIVRHFELVEDVSECSSTGICVVRGALHEQKLLEFGTVIASKREDDKIAKSFRSMDEKCSLYLYSRDSLRVVVDSTPHLPITPKTYFYFLLEAGRHNITTHLYDEITTQQIDCEIGEVVFVEMDINAGWWKYRATLQTVDSGLGREAILNRNLIISDWVVSSQRGANGSKGDLWEAPEVCSLYIYRTGSKKLSCGLRVEVGELDTVWLGFGDYVNPMMKPGLIKITAVWPSRNIYSEHREELQIDCKVERDVFVRIDVKDKFLCPFELKTVAEEDSLETLKNRRLLPLHGNAE